MVAMKKTWMAVWVSAALGAGSSLVVAQEVVIAGSTTVQKRIVEPAAAKLKEATGVDVKFQGTGTGKGMISLVEGKVTVAAASESLDDAVASAQKAAKEAEKSFNKPGNLEFHSLYMDSIVVVVNKDNPVANLSKDQLKDLNTGKVKNWKDVGGPDLPVKVVTSHAGSATRQVFQKQIMGGAEYAADAAEVRTTREELNEVSKNKGAIGAVSEGFFNQNKGSTKLVKAPEIKRPLALVTAGKPSADVQKVIDFLKSKEGQALIQ